MSDVVVVCTDGSEIATQAASHGLATLRDDANIVVVTVLEEDDASLVSGAGMAGGVMSAEEFDTYNRERETTSREVLQQALSSLGLKNTRTEILRGSAGPALCDFASEVGAAVIVIGTRGRGGLKRAFLGSVSDHIVRNAPCSVLVTGPAATESA
jgi:nucleotide-binding universal stress UspA family protein